MSKKRTETLRPVNISSDRLDILQMAKWSTRTTDHSASDRARENPMPSHSNFKSVEASKLMELVLKTLCDDLESLPTLLDHLNRARVFGEPRFRNHTFTQREILQAMEDLVNREMVKVLRYSATTRQLEDLDARTIAIRDHIDELWFELTDKGHAACQEWLPRDD